MSSSATGVGMPICFLGAILLILTQKSSQKFGDVLGIMSIIIKLRKTLSNNNFKSYFLLCKNAYSESTTCNGVQLQDRLTGHSFLCDDISLRIGLIVGIFAIANLIVFFEFS